MDQTFEPVEFWRANSSKQMVSRGGVIAAEWSLAGVSCVFVILRVWTRLRILELGLTREDALIVFAQLVFFGWISCDLYNSTLGLFDHGTLSYYGDFISFIDGTSNKVKVLKVLYASGPPFYLDLWIIKFAILSLYFKIVPHDMMRVRYFLVATTIFAGCTGLATVAINVLLCQPISRNWSLNPSDSCYSSTAVLPFVISVVSNFITDMLIFFIPFPVIRGLKTLSKPQKMGLIVTFSVGGINILLSVVRIAVLATLGWISVAAIFSALECSTAIIVACLPALRVLLRIGPFVRRSREYGEEEEGLTSNGSIAVTATNVTDAATAYEMDYYHKGSVGQVSVGQSTQYTGEFDLSDIQRDIEHTRKLNASTDIHRAPLPTPPEHDDRDDYLIHTQPLPDPSHY